MRVLAFLCCVVVFSLWLIPRAVGAGGISNVERAENLETSLQAVEWYTNEAVRKALQAESHGDVENARLFGNKAVESDLKAKDLRNETAAAWLAVGQQDKAQATWLRAAEMAEERAVMLAKRIPTLRQQWLADSGNAEASRESEVYYLQSIVVTAQQWELVVKFAREAGEEKQAEYGVEQLRELLPALQKDSRLQALAQDPRLSGNAQQLADWEQLVSRP